MRGHQRPRLPDRPIHPSVHRNEPCCASTHPQSLGRRTTRPSADKGRRRNRHGFCRGLKTWCKPVKPFSWGAAFDRYIWNFALAKPPAKFHRSRPGNAPRPSPTKTENFLQGPVLRRWVPAAPPVCVDQNSDPWFSQPIDLRWRQGIPRSAKIPIGSPARFRSQTGPHFD
jgi:hypothetical protein